mgnify:CR=1 FL=1
MRPAVVLLSGGLDSAVVAAHARDQGFKVHALTISYGQRHRHELVAAERVFRSLQLSSHQNIEIPLDAFGGSALTGDIDVPKDQEGSPGIPVTYVPARNTVFLSLALAYAETLGSTDLFCGVNAVDYSGYPDCRPEFIEAFQAMARLGTKIGVEGAQITIHAPLLEMTKPEIIQLGLRMGVDFSQTHSCYDPGLEGEPCRHCDSCLIRMKAFLSLGMEDPVLVRTPT